LSKKLFIKTYGCQMNVYDSGRMADVLAPLGYEPASSPEEADMIILNTCHIREKAAEKVFSELGRMRAIKAARAARGEDTLIAVAGCVAQAEGREITRRAPCVDMVFGPQTYHRLPEMVARVARAGGKSVRVLETDFPVEAKFDELPEQASSPAPAAFLTVQEGCDKFCTFCVVPYTRGAEYSRPLADVLAEARRLTGAGAREIMLLGQNVNAYHGADGRANERGLGDLIRRLAAIRGLERIRYTTSHPRDMDEALIAVHGEVEALMPSVHLPVQSGAERILEAMNRGHGVREYLAIVDKLRAARGDIALSSDFIVGFPGESTAEFEATMALVRSVGFAQAYSFKYSPRPGTPAAALADQVPEEIKAERLARLQDLLAAQQAAFNKASLGANVPVLLERAGRKPGQLVGRTPHMQAVHVRAPAGMLGRVVDVRLTRALANSFAGEIAASPAKGSGDADSARRAFA
jgi:tRNA-2-methylthio-N6-dimethylallyladenosine synthase